MTAAIKSIRRHGPYAIAGFAASAWMVGRFLFMVGRVIYP